MQSAEEGIINAKWMGKWEKWVFHTRIMTEVMRPENTWLTMASA